MVPHRILSNRWEQDTRAGGLLFDRCRIVHYGNSIKPKRWTTAGHGSRRRLAGSKKRHEAPLPRHLPVFRDVPRVVRGAVDRGLTKPGDLVLDPFSGRGTTATCALLMQRRAIACDVNDVAYCLTRAKTRAPACRPQAATDHPRGGIRRIEWRKSVRSCPEFFRYAFQRRTLAQLLYLPKKLNWKRSRCDGMIAALVMGSLHGEMDKSSSYFSNQMPRTISTKPAYSVRFWKERDLEPPKRDVFALLKRGRHIGIETPPPSGEAVILHRDMRDLARMTDDLPKLINCAIMSPPYLDVTNFEEDQWLRFWFLGGPQHPTRGRSHARPARNIGLLLAVHRGYVAFDSDRSWRQGPTWWSGSAAVSLHADKLRHLLVASSRFSGRPIQLVHYEVSQLKNQADRRFPAGHERMSGRDRLPSPVRGRQAGLNRKIHLSPGP